MINRPHSFRANTRLDLSHHAPTHAQPPNVVRRSVLCCLYSNYPFGVGEEFAEDELREIWRDFDEILLLTLGKSTKITKFVPPNARIIRLRDVAHGFRSTLRALAALATPEYLAEIRTAMLCCPTSLISTLRWLFTYGYFGQAIMASVRPVLRHPNCVLLYSYWFTIGPYAFAHLRAEGYIFKAVARAHGADCFLDRQHLPFREVGLSGLDELHSISRAGLQQISTGVLPNLPACQTNLFVSHLGVHNPRHLRSAYSQDGVIRVVTCSSIIRVKRLDLIIDALTSCTAKTIQWDHFGDGALRKRIHLLAAERFASRPGLSFSFHGQVDRATLFAFYESEPIDLFINFSDSEGIPVSIMEAFAFGVPAVARDVGGCGELVIDGENGMLLPSNSGADDLSAAISRFCDLPLTDRLKMRDNSFEAFSSNWDASANFRRFSAQIRSRMCPGYITHD